MDIAIINLLHRKSRRSRVLALADSLRKVSKQSPSVSIDEIHLMEAVDGVNGNFEQLEASHGGLKPFPNWALAGGNTALPSSWRTNLTSGGVASGLSHMDVATSGIGENGRPSDRLLLVMEDDCVLVGQSDVELAFTQITQCIEEANRLVPSWDLLLLGAAGHRPDLCASQPVPGASLIEIVGFSYLTTMYVLSGRGRKKLRNNHPIVLPRMLPFDELHNAMAGLTPRPDVEREISSKCEKIIMLASMNSQVKQDPFDCVHDTCVMAAGNRETVLAKPPTDMTNLFPYKVFFQLRSGLVGVTWWRRCSGLVLGDVQQDANESKAVRAKKRKSFASVMKDLRDREAVAISGA